MPNICLHMLLADRVLRAWERTPQQAPFDLRDDQAVGSFLHGSVAPDLGYLPRGDRQFSETAHLVATGDFARRLVARARTGPERAYAWGWVTHVLGDLLIHPLIDRAARELVGGGEGPPGDVAHMRVEYGLDAHCFHHVGGSAAVPLRGMPPGSPVALLCGTFREFHGVALDSARVVEGHRVALRAFRLARALNRILGAGWRTDPLPALARALFGVSGRMHRAVAYPRSPVAFAVLSSVRPSGWLAAEVERVVDGFVDFFQEHHRAGLAGLKNFNLKTGEEVTPAVSPHLDRPGPGARPIGAG